jgi:hypothetical protein
MRASNAAPAAWREIGDTPSPERGSLGTGRQRRNVSSRPQWKRNGAQTLSINGIIVQDEVLVNRCGQSRLHGFSDYHRVQHAFPRVAHLDLVWLNSSRELREAQDAGLILTMDAKKINHGDD